jgi:hypothetical protein
MFVILMVFHFRDRDYMGVGQAIFVNIHTHDITLQLSQSIDVPTFGFNAAESYRYLNRVHCNDQILQYIKFRLGLCHLFKELRNNLHGN